MHKHKSLPMRILVSTFVFSLMTLSLTCYISAKESVWMHIAFDQAVQKVQIHPKDPSHIYVTVEGQGILKTADGGINWQKLVFKSLEVIEPRIEPRAPIVIALHPIDTKVLYGIAIAPSGWGFLPIKSYDGGESWEEIWLGLGLEGLWDRARFRAIAVDPNDPETIYLGDASGPPVDGTFVSRDGGRSWKFADRGRGNGASFFAISPVDSTVYAIIPKSPGGFIRKSSDRGNSWRTIFGSIDGTISAIAIDPTTGDVYVHGSSPRLHTGMYRSVNGGEKWESIDNGFPVVSDGLAGSRSRIAALAVDANHPNTIYAGTRVGVYRSQNAGESWQPFNDGLTNLNVHCVAVNPIDSSVYAGTNNGLFKARPSNSVVSVSPRYKFLTTFGQIKSNPFLK